MSDDILLTIILMRIKVSDLSDTPSILLYSLRTPMALVAYEFSDTSDASDLEDNNSVNVATTVPFSSEKSDEDESKGLENCDSIKSGQNLFHLLPQPSNRTSVTEEDDEFLHRKENFSNVKPKAKITVPSLSDFKDVQATIPNVKPKISNGKKSSLLSMLPEPKNAILTKTSNSFVPHVLTQKPSIAVTKTKMPLNENKSAKDHKTNESRIQDYSDDSDTDDIQNDFFSMKKTEETLITSEDINLNVQCQAAMPTLLNNKNDAFIFNKYGENNINIDHNVNNIFEADSYLETSQESNASHEINSIAETSNTNNTLDDEAVLKLCGSRSKRKREEIQIVDVNQREVLADAREWLVKGLMDDTTKRVSVSKKKGGEPTTQQKRKHQITYLAHQAKANEAELQNQWANNRMSKRQTQSKYGF
ncbi:hypothetical protein ACJJTC_015502 [Scirpophaga incertulas]